MADENDKKDDESLDDEEKKIEDESKTQAESDDDALKKTGKGLAGVQEGIQGGLEPADLDEQIKTSFLDYAMSTITSRALPDARDGMKPVQRRIIYGMAAMGVWPDKPFKKSARIVGEVMGKYHPHGDASIYSAMARMAQDFALRNTLVEGHGNFGSQDGDEPAASRYTEARLSKLSLEMVRDMNKDTVDFTDTYDGDGKEPTVLPSRIPNLLVNGSTGIAVGMATNIPTHNLGETFDGIIALMRNPSLEPVELLKYIKGPDFPGGGLICGRAGIRKYFETGIGSVRVRGKYFVKDESGGRQALVFTELPYMVNKKELAKKIMDLVADKTLDGIQEIADYSDDKHGTMFQIDLKKGASPEIVVNHLFKFTDLQSSFPVNMLALDNGTPKVLNMKQALQLYINFQRDVIRRRTGFDLRKAQERIHIIEGLLIAVDNIDEVVRIIRSSNTQDEASAKLKERFHFDDPQVKAILDMTLRRLTGLEKEKLVAEKDQLKKECDEFHHILSDPAYLDEVLIKEMIEIKEKFADPRRTEISDANADDNDEDLIDDAPILIALTKKGYIKRMAPGEFKTQNRGGIGIAGMTTKDDDEVAILTVSRTKTDVLFFTDIGKVYKVRGYQIPEGSRTSKGLPVINFLALANEEKVLAILSVDDYQTDHYLFFATEKGVVKKTPQSEFESITKAGKIALGLKEGDRLFDVKPTDGKAKIALASDAGKLCLFDENEVRPMGRTAAGVKGMNLPEDAKIVGFATSLEGDLTLTVSENGFAKLSPLSEYRETSRGSMGVLTLKIGEKTGKLVAMDLVKGNEDVLVITDAGTVMKTSLTQVKTVSRASVGVILVRVRDGEKIASVSVAPADDTIQEEADRENAIAKENQAADDAKTQAALLKGESSDDGDDDDSDGKKGDGDDE